MPRARDLLGNLGSKVAAVVLAYVFWLVVIEEPQAVRQLDVPVRFFGLSPTLSLVPNRPSTVTVVVQGAESIAKDLLQTDVEARIDLGGRGAGAHNIRLSPASPAIFLRRPGLKVIEVSPAVVAVVLEARLVTEVPVRALLVGTPPAGFEVTQVDVNPGKVRIDGPESAVKRTTDARTREVSLDGKRAPFDEEVLIDVANPDVVIASESRVRIRVGVRETSGDASFSDVPVTVLGCSHELRLAPHLVRIDVSGPSRIVSQLRKDDLAAEVDLPGCEPRPDEVRRPVRVRFGREPFKSQVQGRVVPEQVGVRVLARKAPVERRPANGG